MRIESSLSPWSEINRAWNLIDRYWPSREYDLVSATFPIDMYEQDGNVFVRASIPGVKPEDINVSIEHNVLTISGEVRDIFEEGRGGRVFHREHTFGKFLRSIRLPGGINENDIDAQIEGGILTVAIPLSTKDKTSPKRIAIRTDNGDQKPIEAHRSEEQRGTDKKKDTEKHPVGAEPKR